MLAWETAAFTLFLNSGTSFLAGLLIVWACVRIFRIENSGWKLFLLTLPFLKILLDLYRGIPSDSLLHTGILPFSLPPKHQTLKLVWGFWELGPLFNLSFSARDLAGHEYSTSIAEIARDWLIRWGGAGAPRGLLVSLLSVSLVLIVRRALTIVFFERRRRRARLRAQSLGLQRCGFRKIDLYLTDETSGTPFTGGLFRPYICFPKKTRELLSQKEFESVLQHEVAHVRHFDLLTNLAIAFLGDVFWFVPFYRLLSRRLDRLREVLADRAAVRSGASAAHLASAILALEGELRSLPAMAPASAFTKDTSLLKERVQRLLNEFPGKGARLGWNYRWSRVLIAIWTAGAVMAATLGGSHELGGPPDWISPLLKWIGLA